jgi:hypothetical protein
LSASSQRAGSLGRFGRRTLARTLVPLLPLLFLDRLGHCQWHPTRRPIATGPVKPGAQRCRLGCCPCSSRRCSRCLSAMHVASRRSACRFPMMPASGGTFSCQCRESRRSGAVAVAVAVFSVHPMRSVMAVSACAFRIVRIGDSIVSVVCDGAQLAILLLFCNAVRQPIAQIAVSATGSRSMHVVAVATRLRVWRV